MELTVLLQRLRAATTEAEQQTLRHQLEAYINELINQDFNRLVQLLYSVDVDEQKLKTVLRAQPEHNAAALITELILNRIKAKAQSRQQFTNNTSLDADEPW